MAGKGNPKGSNGGGGMIKGQRRGESKADALLRMGVTQHIVDAPTPVERTQRRRRAVAVLSEAMEYFLGLAAKFQPIPTNAEADERKFAIYLDKAVDAAGKLAPFESPKLSAVTVREVPMDLTKLSDMELQELERLHAKAAIAGGDQVGDQPAAVH